jgi:hypothetical protein
MKIQKLGAAALACFALASCTLDDIANGIDNFVDAFVDASQPGSAYNNPNYNPDAGSSYNSGASVCPTGYPFVACNGFVSCTSTPLPPPSCNTSPSVPGTPPGKPAPCVKGSPCVSPM